jgi:predicted nucleotidyltransferase
LETENEKPDRSGKRAMSDNKRLNKVLEQVTSDTQNALGSNLISLLLYGSHARSDATERSDVNLFLVIRDGNVKSLEPLLKLVPGWMKQNVTAPVIFEQDQLARSFDTFALEFLEMAAARQVLSGEDPFAEFTPDWQAVRWELEQEAREKTTALQRRWLASGGKDRLLRATIAQTVPGYLSILRGTLHLQRRNTVPILTLEIFDGAIHWPGFDPLVWRRLWEASKEMHFPSTAALTQLMRDYLEQARTLVRQIDGLLSHEGIQ